jgi:hypothetical protein
MAKLMTLKYNEHEIKKWEVDDGFRCYDVSDIARAINVKKVRNSLSNFANNEIVHDEDKERYGIKPTKLHRGNVAIDMRKTLLTEQGLKRFLCICRSPACIDLAKFLGLDVYSYKPHIKETTYLNSIMKALKGEQIQLQYNPEGTNYRIDAYMPKYNIAIECDEAAHNY